MKTKSIILIGMFAAILSVLSQVSLPLASGVPLTLQTFAIALTGYLLGAKLGSISVLVYLLLGIVGLPVFSGLKGGVQAIVGYTGGFLIGFPFLAALSGIGNQYKQKSMQVGWGLIGLFLVHLLGTFQYCILSKQTFLHAVLLVSVPYLIKDVISVIIAYVLGKVIKKQIIIFGGNE